MDRRTFIGTLAGGLVATPSGALAQQPAIPAIGLLRSTPAAPFAHLVEAFRQGLKEAGYGTSCGALRGAGEIPGRVR